MQQRNWSEIVCADCTAEILTYGWGPAHHDLLVGKPKCFGCQDRLAELSVALGGTFQTRPWQDLSAAQARQRSARHEAAHAVVGAHGGLIVTEAAVVDASITVGGASSTQGGHVNFDFPEQGVPLESVMTALHAGWANDRAWLVQQGQDQPHYLLDAAYSATQDMEVLAGFCTDPQAHARAMQDAEALVSEHAREITAVHEELLRHSHLGHEAVRAAMELTHRPTSAPTPAAPAPKPARQPRSEQPAPAAPTTTGGTTAMGIEEIKGQLGQASGDLDSMRGALAEALHGAETLAGQLAGLMNGSGAEEATTATGGAGQLAQTLTEAVQQIGVIQHAVESYGGRL